MLKKEELREDVEYTYHNESSHLHGSIFKYTGVSSTIEEVFHAQFKISREGEYEKNAQFILTFPEDEREGQEDATSARYVHVLTGQIRSDLKIQDHLASKGRP